MSYSVTARWGDSVDEPNENRMRELLAQLDKHDPEHPDTWLTHESGWTLSFFETGLLIWENLESEGQPRHQVDISKEKALSLWLKLSRGEIAEIEKEPWSPGQAPPISPEKRAELIKQSEEATRRTFRDFYDKLGHENKKVPCRRSGCERGAIRNSVFCKVHHFGSIYKTVCPFNH